MTMCLGCGCTDECACPGGCAWLIRFDDGTGICSDCPDTWREYLACVANIRQLCEAPIMLPDDPQFGIGPALQARAPSTEQ